MTLWLLFALMTAAAIFAVVWPLGRRPKAAAAGNDVAVYRDQLDEIDRDRALGTIGTVEAEAARVEVSRRLLAAADAADAPKSRTDDAGLTWRRRLAALAMLVAVPLVAGPFYFTLGSPDLPGQPYAERLARVHDGVPMTAGGQNTQGQSIEALIARVEAYLERNPEDGRGWELIAPVYMRIGAYEAAAKARANALRILGSTADREADYGEATMAAANGVITAEAKASFDRAIKLDPKNVSARFYLGLAAEQDGRKTEALATWRALLAEASPDAGWTDFVTRAIARVEGKPVSTPPDRAVVAAKAPAEASAPAQSQANAPDPQQNDMVRGMVARLAERLQQDGTDVDGWLRLVRSYTVLGDPEKARSAVANARRAIAGDPDKLRRLDAGLKELGFDG